ncbi:MAG: hypothetical protein Q9172_000774 [Xanthocarpia lactea]
MSSVHHAHLRTSPPQARKSAVKAARPAALGAPKSFFRSNCKVKQGRDKSKGKGEEVIDCNDTAAAAADDDDDDMATSFLQFWYNLINTGTWLSRLTHDSVTCDRQILVPKNSLLYCSERCKRMDAQHVSDYSSYVPMNSPPSSENGDHDPLGSKKPSLVPRAVPTPRPASSARIPPEAHEGRSDLDPTEWKPKLSHCPSSDASMYLSQFHRTPPAYGSPRGGSHHRPAALRTQTADSVSMNAPSLSATPSASSTSSGDSIAGTPYDFSERPSVPSRPDPVHSKSVNLVTPHQKVSTAYSVPFKPTAHGHRNVSLKVNAVAAVSVKNATWGSDLSYAKEWNLASGCHSAGSGRLTTLLGAASSNHKATL